MCSAVVPMKELADRSVFLRRFQDVRCQSKRLCDPLETEDMVIQAMSDVSPPKWHLAHTTWFFEAFILKEFDPTYSEFDVAFNFLFNSYYQSLGKRHARPQRGFIARPTVSEVNHYRIHVDEAMTRLISDCEEAIWQGISPLIEIGINHEQQHQELLVTDIKYNFSVNPINPVYQPQLDVRSGIATPLRFQPFDPGLQQFGYDGIGFCYDNETPSHCAFVQTFAMANRLTTNAEYLEFINDDAYTDPLLWLADGWNTVTSQRWSAPLYWQQIDGVWWQTTLSGLQLVQPNEPVCHVSYYEADAFARWAGKRLLRETEWEAVAVTQPIDGNFAESELCHPSPLTTGSDGIAQLFGDVWEWTQSPYVGYPGYRPAPRAVGEYNGKFMSNQMVLRGGSCATPQSHIRATYRNFFPPDARWQFSGIRLGEDR